MATDAQISRADTALARLDAAAQSEGIEPGSYLGGWAAAQRDLVEALFALEHNRAEQMQGMLAMTKATTEAGTETMRLQVEAMQLELRKIDRFIEQAKISLGEGERDGQGVGGWFYREGERGDGGPRQGLEPDALLANCRWAGTRRLSPARNRLLGGGKPAGQRGAAGFLAAVRKLAAAGPDDRADVLRH